MKKKVKVWISSIFVFVVLGQCLPAAFAGSAVDLEPSDTISSSSNEQSGFRQAQDNLFDTAIGNVSTGANAQLDLTQFVQSLLNEMGAEIVVQNAIASVSYADQMLNLIIDASLVYKEQQLADTIVITSKKTTDESWEILNCSDSSGILTAMWSLWKIAQNI